MRRGVHRRILTIDARPPGIIDNPAYWTLYTIISVGNTCFKEQGTKNLEVMGRMQGRELMELEQFLVY